MFNVNTVFLKNITCREKERDGQVSKEDLIALFTGCTFCGCVYVCDDNPTLLFQIEILKKL